MDKKDFLFLKVSRKMVGVFKLLALFRFSYFEERGHFQLQAAIQTKTSKRLYQIEHFLKVLRCSENSL